MEAVGAVPHEGHIQPSVQPGPGDMVTSQDGDLGGCYSIGEAPSPLWRIREAVRLSWTDPRQAGNAAGCQHADTLDLSPGEGSYRRARETPRIS